MKKWASKHLILIWAIASILYAIVIHCLFSTPAPSEFWVHKWEAGDILTYVSTVSLGLLAVWQNKRFKEENDVSQERLEQLARQANEISTINKIIEYETDNLSRLRAAIDEFSNICDPSAIAASYVRVNSPNNSLADIILKMSELDTLLDSAFFQLCRELRIDHSKTSASKDSFIVIMGSYYMTTKECIAKLQGRLVDEVMGKSEIYKNLRVSFVKAREEYLMKKEKNLNELLYSNLTLNEIKARCYQNNENTEDTENE